MARALTHTRTFIHTHIQSSRSATIHIQRERESKSRLPVRGWMTWQRVAWSEPLLLPLLRVKYQLSEAHTRTHTHKHAQMHIITHKNSLSPPVLHPSFHPPFSMALGSKLAPSPIIPKPMPMPTAPAGTPRGLLEMQVRSVYSCVRPCVCAYVYSAYLSSVETQ